MAEVSNTHTVGGELSSMQGGELSSMQCGGCEAQWDMSEHRPLVLPCGHCSCSSCCITQRRAGKLICRLCPHTFLDPWTPNTETPVNYFILELITSKDEDEQENGDLSISNSNSSIVVPGLVKEPANQKGICVEHKLYKTFRCKVCSVDICQQCAEECHSMESCQVLSISQDIHLNELASETKQVVSKQSAVCQKKLEKISKCKMILDSEQKLIKEQIKNIQSEINKHNQVYETILKEKELLDSKILKNNEVLPLISNSEEPFIPDETTSNYAKKVMSEVSCCLVIRGLWQYLYGGVTSDRSLSEMHEAWSINMDTNDWGDWEALGPHARWTEQGILEEPEVAPGNQDEQNNHDGENTHEQTAEQENESAETVIDNGVNNEAIVNDAVESNTLNEETSHDDGSENEARSRLSSDLHEISEINGTAKNVAESEKLDVQVGECSSTTAIDTSCNSDDQSNCPEDKESSEPRKVNVENSTDLSNTESQDGATDVIQSSENGESEISNQNENVDSTDNGARNNDNESEENHQQNLEETDDNNRLQSNNSIPNAGGNNEVDLDADEESSEESEEGNVEENQATEENQDKALWPHCFSDRYRIEVLVSIAGAVEPSRSVVWCAWRCNDGGEKVRWAKLTIRDGLLHLHHLQNNPPPSDSLLLMHDMVKSAISRVDSIQRCFLDLSWAGKERGRIYIEVHQRYTNPASLLKQLIQHFAGERSPYTQARLELKDKHFITLGDTSNWKTAPNKLLDRRSYFTGMLFVPENCGGTLIEKPNLSLSAIPPYSQVDSLTSNEIVDAVRSNDNSDAEAQADLSDNPVVEDSQTLSDNEAGSFVPTENPDTRVSNDISNAQAQVHDASERAVASNQILHASTSDAMPTPRYFLSHLISDQTVPTHQNQEGIRISNASTPISTAAVPNTSGLDPPLSPPPLSLAILLRGSRISPPGPCLGSVTSGLSILLAAAAAVSAKHKVTITGCGLADNKGFEFYGQ